MAVTATGRIAPSPTGQLRPCPPARFSGRNGRSVNFCNGELMGEKINLAAITQQRNKNINAIANPICNSVTADFAGETKRDPRTVVAIILGGGAGTRLFPLTKRRAKPAVPIGGAYRLIDVPMSNCINSGVNKVYILTQFNSASLNRHLARAYNFGSGVTFGDGFVEVLAATQTPGEAGKSWFQGTADAVRQFHWLFEDPRSKDIEDVLILSGDHLYRMDYMDFVQNHRQSGADITISCLPIDGSRASDFGLMMIDNKGRVLSFSEKPKGNDLKAMAVDTTVLGLSRDEAEKKPYIASMGVYVFKKEILLNLLSFYDATKPIYTSRRNLPPSKIDNSKIIDSIVSHGSFLNNCVVEHSVVGIRSRINSNVHLMDTVMLGADYYETDSEIALALSKGKVPIGIGENTRIK
ncbi:glucose-1-phosphate adenylyltransferase large subunit 1 chloroplastic [Phtheirospermum japonicum]|uniref:glucose-1-phosphate adenylyltransferase n=1 Tax=Phtheirospermum japonicum TaxID=374723 RepID=A0A830BPR6_9LAMI|nr:glucose-1-phosphate adenylyltransferase large subunit 1 chloroplastic [Phtheirospermum japonicum]